ncbi:hypothetical protein K443DRAFT_14186 [Laccaria amethystina LaAM-08-1]|uniref:CCL2-like lectin domain-containing protein n=1 Tax=Laccaria amethystina LaAM-08-1 TaxID=1095629 RepID=A0A0C9WTP0_9AGAR|nr:hypothetical protein K443DRAFT_14186 [Laccaria amethystina LaAM-08-1]
MQFKTIVNAVTLVLFIAGAHANAPDGTYSIINKVPSTSNKAKIRPADRAITFNGKGKPLTVLWDNPDSPEQSIEDFDKNTQTISLAVAGDFEGERLQCASEKNVVTFLPANDYVRTITPNNGPEATYMYI